MALQDFLSPSERIRSSGPAVSVGEQKYCVYITSERLILHRTEGMVFKNDQVLSEPIQSIRHIQFQETGMIWKDATIYIEFTTRKLLINGKAAELRGLYQVLLAASAPEAAPTPVVSQIQYVPVAVPAQPAPQPARSADAWPPPGAHVNVSWPDGQEYVAVVVGSAGDSTRIRFPDARTATVPTASLSPFRANKPSTQIVEKQILVVRCKYCSALTPLDLTSCKTCGGAVGA